MKTKIFILLAYLSIALTACTETDDSNGNDSIPAGALPSAEFTPNNLPAEPYAEDVIQVIAKDADAPFYSLELMADGHYLLTTSRPSGAYNAPVRVAAKANGQFAIHKTRNSNAARTRGTVKEDGTMTFEDGSEYGEFEKSGDKQYILSNGATVNLMNATGSDKSIVYTTAAGRVCHVYVNVSTPDAGNGTTSICRTWDFNSFECWYYWNNKYIAHGKQTLRNGRVESEFSTIGMFDLDKEDVLIEDDAFAYKVIFTPANTYICFYLDGTSAVSHWRWIDKSQGILYYDWEDGGDSAGYLTVRFAGNQMRVYEDYTFSDDESDMKARFVAVNTLTAAHHN